MWTYNQWWWGGGGVLWAEVCSMLFMVCYNKSINSLPLWAVSMFNKNKSSDAITEIWGNGPKGLKQKTNMEPVIGFCLINKTKLMIDDFDKPANKLTKYKTKLLLVTFGIVKRSSPARSKTAMSLELYKKNQFLIASLSQLNRTKCMSRFKILKLVWFWLFLVCFFA